MAVNKNALIRYKVLDRCFGNPGKRYFIEDLITECNKQLLEINPGSQGIQKRQIFEDIKFMESAEGWSAEIERVAFGKRKFYRYRNMNFSINNQPLNAAEIEQLKASIDIISRFRGMPQFEWINEFTPKLEQSFTIKPAVPIISFDNNEYLKGINFIGDLFHAVLYKKVLRIVYTSYKNPIAGIYLIHPYYLKQYNNRWFLLGYNQEIDRLTNLALDRISSIEEIDLPYIENLDYDFNEYFEDIIGVTKPRDEKLSKITLKFSEAALPYVLSKPLHGSQKISNVNGEKLISLEIIPNFELESLLLSFGERVTIISPSFLKEKIMARLQKALDSNL